MSNDQPPNMRSFSLNSPEGEAALRVPRPSWVWAGGLAPEPRRPREGEGVWVDAETDSDAGDALAQWRRHVEAGRIPVR